MRKLLRWLFAVSFQTPWTDSQRHVWSRRQTRARTLGFCRGGLTGRCERGAPSDGMADETEREKFCRNTKSSSVLVGAAGNRSRETMTTALPATDGLVSEVNPTYLEDIWRNFHKRCCKHSRRIFHVCSFLCHEGSRAVSGVFNLTLTHKAEAARDQHNSLRLFLHVWPISDRNPPTVDPDFSSGLCLNHILGAGLSCNLWDTTPFDPKGLDFD